MLQMAKLFSSHPRFRRIAGEAPHGEALNLLRSNRFTSRNHPPVLFEEPNIRKIVGFSAAVAHLAPDTHRSTIHNLNKMLSERISEYDRLRGNGIRLPPLSEFHSANAPTSRSIRYTYISLLERLTSLVVPVSSTARARLPSGAQGKEMEAGVLAREFHSLGPDAEGKKQAAIELIGKALLLNDDDWDAFSRHASNSRFLHASKWLRAILKLANSAPNSSTRLLEEECARMSLVAQAASTLRGPSRRLKSVRKGVRVWKDALKPNQ